MAESHREEIAKLEALYAGNPGGRVFVHLAEALRKAGDYERARGILQEGLARHSDSASGYVVLGRLLTDLQVDLEAESAFRRVLELDGGNLIALRGLADLALRGGRRQEAVGYYRDLLARNPSSDDVRMLLVQLETQAQPEVAEPVREAHEQAAPPQPDAPFVTGEQEEPGFEAAGAESGEAGIAPYSAAPGDAGAAAPAEPEFGFIDLEDALTGDAELSSAAADLSGFEGFEESGWEVRSRDADLTDLLGTGQAEAPPDLTDFSDLDTLELGGTESDSIEDTDSFGLHGVESLELPADTAMAADSLDVPLYEVVEQGSDEAWGDLDGLTAGEPVAEEAGEGYVGSLDLADTGDTPGPWAGSDPGEPPRAPDDEITAGAAAEDEATGWSGAEEEAGGPEEEAGGPAARDEAAGWRAGAEDEAGWPGTAGFEGAARPDEPEPDYPEPDEPRPDDAVPAAEAQGPATFSDGLLTETMADLYRSQGFHDRAAEVYRALLRQRPDDESLMDRLRQAEEAWLQGLGAAWTGAAAEAAAAESPYAWSGGREEEGSAETAAAGPPIGMYLREILSWTPAAGAATAAAEPPAQAGEAEPIEAGPAGGDQFTSGAEPSEPEPWAPDSSDTVEVPPAAEPEAEYVADDADLRPGSGFDEPWSYEPASEERTAEVSGTEDSSLEPSGGYTQEGYPEEAAEPEAPAPGDATLEERTAEPWAVAAQPEADEPWAYTPQEERPAPAFGVPSTPAPPERQPWAESSRPVDDVEAAFNDWYMAGAGDEGDAAAQPAAGDATEDPGEPAPPQAGAESSGGEDDDEDLAMFRSWLQSLKK